MCHLVTLRCAAKFSKAMTFLVLFVVILCGSAFASDSSASSNLGVNSSQSANQNSSIVAQLNLQRPEVSQDQSHQVNSSVGSSQQISSKAVANPVKPQCKTEPCQSDVKQNISKSLASNSSQESTNPVESSINTSDASVELNKKLNPEALMRGFYVFVGLSAIVIAYIAWKSFGKRPAQVHRYGVITNREDLEMAPLDSDEGDEDDTTHFDLSKHRLT